VKLNLNTEEFRRSELPEKYIAEILFGWDNGKFEVKYSKKLKKIEQDRRRRRRKS